MAITKEKAIDILDKIDFFQGQRAGRELWNERPRDVQELDLRNFQRDVALLKEYINTAEVEKIFAEIDLIFRKYYEEYSEKSDLKLLEPIRQAERFIINEMWHEFAELKKKYIGDKR